MCSVLPKANPIMLCSDKSFLISHPKYTRTSSSYMYVCAHVHTVYTHIHRHWMPYSCIVHKESPVEIVRSLYSTPSIYTSTAHQVQSFHKKT